MGKDCGSRLHQQYSFLKSPNLNFTSTIPYLGQQKFVQPFRSTHTCMVSANGSLPGMAVPRLPHLKRFQGNEGRQQSNFQPFTKPHACMVSANGSLPGLKVPGLPHSKESEGIKESKWFCCLPYRCESGTPLPDTAFKENLSTIYKCGVEATSNAVPGSAQKRFLVFDQSGNQTNLIFSSLIASPAQNLNMVNAAPIETCGSQQKEQKAKVNLVTPPWPVIYDGMDGNQKSSEESEMHEDTEELDALLYSDDSNCDDEEISTAHSPGEVTGWCKNQEEIEESGDEVTSPIGATKRKRLPDEEDGQSLLRDTASSLNLLENEDDAESSCVNGRFQGKPCSLEANKRLKQERIWDTLSILQSIIPGGNGKDTALVLDEAIQYLRFLKVKARFLGVSME